MIKCFVSVFNGSTSRPFISNIFKGRVKMYQYLRGICTIKLFPYNNNGTKNKTTKNRWSTYIFGELYASISLSENQCAFLVKGLSRLFNWRRWINKYCRNATVVIFQISWRKEYPQDIYTIRNSHSRSKVAQSIEYLQFV